MDITSRAPLNFTDISTLSAAGTGSTSGGSCGCCAPTQTTQTQPVTADAISEEYFVDGLTCGSCAARVSTALAAVAGVEDVQISLVPGGTSTVSVTNSQPLLQASVQDAVEKAGYQLTIA